jgi:hypothetical protein
MVRRRAAKVSSWWRNAPDREIVRGNFFETGVKGWAENGKD